MCERIVDISLIRRRFFIASLPNVLSKYSVVRRVYLSDQARTQLCVAQ